VGRCAAWRVQQRGSLRRGAAARYMRQCAMSCPPGVGEARKREAMFAAPMSSSPML